MQSRLSEASGRRSSQPLRSKLSGRPTSSTPFGISKIRERAGSLLGRKRTGTGGTSNSDPSTPGKEGGRFRNAQRERERDIEEVDQRERQEGYGRSLGAGQNFAPPEVPRV